MLAKVWRVLFVGISVISCCSWNASANNYVVKPEVLNVRSGPSTTYPVIGKLKEGKWISTVQDDNEWYEVKLANGTGFVLGKSLSRISNTVKLRVKSSVANVREKPNQNANIVMKLKEDDSIKGIEFLGDWVKIETKDQYAYISNTVVYRPWYTYWGGILRGVEVVGVILILLMILGSDSGGGSCPKCKKGSMSVSKKCIKETPTTMDKTDSVTGKNGIIVNKTIKVPAIRYVYETTKKCNKCGYKLVETVEEIKEK